MREKKKTHRNGTKLHNEIGTVKKDFMEWLDGGSRV